MGSLIVTQLLRFFGNIVLTKLLSPSAFGVVAIVNMTMMGISLLSDIGIRYLVIQRQGELTRDYLNTVWTLQVIRGVGIFSIATILAFALLLLQSHSLVGGAYSDEVLPYLVFFCALSAVLYGFESTKSITERRNINLGRLTVIGIGSQVLALAIMFSVAVIYPSPWVLVIGAVVTAAIQMAMSHFFLPGENNRFHFDKEIIREFLQKGRLVLLWSPVTFLVANAEIMILGGLVDSTRLGSYMIAYLLVNAVSQASSTLNGNIFFPGLSASVREAGSSLVASYRKFQLVLDGLVLTASGFLIAASRSLVDLLFDARYSSSADILAVLSVGLIGLRYSVIEQIANAHGAIKFGILISLSRLVVLVLGVFVGYSLGGIIGAAIGVSLSAFAGWPMLLWFRSKYIPFPWFVEVVSIFIFGFGFLGGLAFVKFLPFAKAVYSVGM